MKGKYIEALDHKCLQDQEIMDARRPLYKVNLFFYQIWFCAGRRCTRSYYHILNVTLFPASFTSPRPELYKPGVGKLIYACKIANTLNNLKISWPQLSLK